MNRDFTYIVDGIIKVIDSPSDFLALNADTPVSKEKVGCKVYNIGNNSPISL